MSEQKRNRSNIIDEDTFAESLDNLMPEDMSDTDTPETKVNFGDIIRKCLMVICAAVFVYNGGVIVNQLVSKARANDTYEDIRDLFYDNSGIAPDGSLVMSLPLSPISLDDGDNAGDGAAAILENQLAVKNKISMLKEINPDMYGWIKINGTRVDYPVVQTTDNDYYLYYGFDKKFTYAGTLFVDCNNSKSLFENYNTVIYGHNMNDGSMFSTLFAFRDKNFFENGVVEIMTDDGMFTYEVFSVHVVHERDPYFVTSFANEKQFVEFAESMQSRSMHNKNIEFTPEDRILTLSTCTNVRSYERYAVHARLVDWKIVVN